MDKKEFITIDKSNSGIIGKYEYLSKGYYEEKKSKFYSYIFTINSEYEVLEIINKVKTEYKDARHVVYSYVVMDTYGYSDDGEPSGTAGKMIYSLLEKQKISNVLVVVIRYFGGVLLGVGPLARAYLKSVKDAEKDLETVVYVPKNVVTFKLSYEQEPVFRKIVDSNKIKIIDTEHAENVTYTIELTIEQLELFDKYEKS